MRADAVRHLGSTEETGGPVDCIAQSTNATRRREAGWRHLLESTVSAGYGIPQPDRARDNTQACRRRSGRGPSHPAPRPAWRERIGDPKQRRERPRSESDVTEQRQVVDAVERPPSWAGSTPSSTTPGSHAHGPAVDTPTQEWERMVALSVQGPMYVTQPGVWPASAVRAAKRGRKAIAA